MLPAAGHFLSQGQSCPFPWDQSITVAHWQGGRDSAQGHPPSALCFGRTSCHGEHQLVAHTAWGILTQPRFASREFSSSQHANMELCSAQAQAVSPLLFVLGSSTVFPRAALQAGSVAPDLLCSVCVQIPHLWGLSRVIRGLRAGQSLSGGWLIYKCSDCPQS